MLYQSSFGTMLRESNNAFSVIESVHVLSITLLVGTIAVLDLRMLGLILRSVSVSQPGTERVAALMVRLRRQRGQRLPALLGRSGKDVRQSKFPGETGLLVLAGFNALVFHTTIYRRAREWETLQVCPWRARVTPLHR